MEQRLGYVIDDGVEDGLIPAAVISECLWFSWIKHRSDICAAKHFESHKVIEFMMRFTHKHT